ncbi:MAG: phenylalanine--tRNA ligase subunit beta [Bacteroidales bacterium]|jgi:phenylalanyl-tRNA synthetase beta chain|nr:phenylalanine--tRNA ligase subunit beta [Bacteroidales bacterium]
MKISYNWLKQYIDFPFEAIELAKILTDTGLEVEGIDEFVTVKGGLKGVVIGKVLTCSKHPNADKLSVTTVDIGEEETLQIVCGAPNVAEGQTVPVAVVGTTLYPAGSEEGFTIKKAKIRGEASSGMICAEDELGLGSDHDGIMVLSDKAKAGSKASDYFKLEKDIVFEIGLTPNRIDGASHIGVARDIAAYLKHNGNASDLNKPSVEEYKQDDTNLMIDVKVLNEEACPRYSGVCLTNLEIKDSPEWLQNKLKSIGQTPINNVVDITNFVLHETGQPLHAFDADKIKGSKVIVRTMDEGTPFTTLDEKERKLTANDLMICNEDDGMCIGGVFGGAHSGVTETTKSIFLESACFDPVYIRKSAKHHQLNTDASFRFERGTDPNGTIYALKRAAMLMKEIAGAKVSSAITDLYPKPIEDFRVEVSFASITRLIGKKIAAETITSILESLDIKVEKQDAEGMVLNVPPYRVDVKREADIIEEILRIYGYNNIEFDEHVNSTLSYANKPDKEQVVNTISDLLSANGYLEIKSNSLTREVYFEEDDNSVVKIHNPLSQDLSRLRQSLLPGGLEAIIYNVNRKRADLKLYEFGSCYFFNSEKETDNPQKKYSEEFHMGIFLSGKDGQDNWTTATEESTFYHLKSMVSLILAKLGVDMKKLLVSETSDASFDQALQYSIEKGKVVSLGKVSSKALKAFDIKQDVYAAEFNWDLIMRLLKKSKVTFQALPRFPEVKRDLSLMLDKTIKFEQLQELAFKTEKRLLKHVDLFDVYEGDKIEAGKKSYALSFILLDEEKTLTDKQIDKVMKKISQSYERELAAVVRGS